jgi:predicted Zn-dependent protease
MATYTRFEVALPPSGVPGYDPTWIDVIGSSYSANNTTIVITNTDGTLTRSAFPWFESYQAASASL